MTLTAVTRVEPQDTGVASALVNASQQIGVALGLGVLSTVAVTATNDRHANAQRALYEGRSSGDVALVNAATDALVHGYARGLFVGAIVLAVAAVLTATLVNTRAVQSGESTPRIG